MRSRLEAGFAMWLDAHRFNWEYEPCAFASESGQYLPDFLLRSVPVAWLDARRDCYVEVRPTSWGRARKEYAVLSEQCAIIKASYPDSLFVLVQPRLTSERSALANSPSSWMAEVSRVGVLERTDLDALWWPIASSWSYMGDFLSGDVRLGLCRPLEWEQGPWPDGYWKPVVETSRA